MLNWNSPPPGGGNTRRQGAIPERLRNQEVQAALSAKDLFGPQNKPEPRPASDPKRRRVDAGACKILTNGLTVTLRETFRSKEFSS